MHVVTESVVGQNPCRKEGAGWDGCVCSPSEILSGADPSRGLKVLPEVSSELAQLKEPSWKLGLGGRQGTAVQMASLTCAVCRLMQFSQAHPTHKTPEDQDSGLLSGIISHGVTSPAKAIQI